MSTQPSPFLMGQRLAGHREESSASDLQQAVTRVLMILRHRRWSFVFPLLTGVLISLVVSLFLPRTYYLKALIERRDDAVITSLIDKNSPYSFEPFRESAKVDLAGYNAVSKAVEQLSLTRDLPRDPDGELTAEGKRRKHLLVSGLAAQLTVLLTENGRYADMIALHYVGGDPSLGAKLVNQLKDNYVATMGPRIVEVLKRSHEFFAEELEGLQERVIGMEVELLQTIAEHPGITNPDLLDQRLMKESGALENLSARRAEAASKIAALEEYLRDLQRQKEPGAVSTTRPAILTLDMIPNPLRGQLEIDMNVVRKQIADAKSVQQMTDLHPRVIALRRKLDELLIECTGLPETIPSSDSAGINALATDPFETERRRTEMELKTLREILGQIAQDTQVHEAATVQLQAEKGELSGRREKYLLRQEELEDARSDLNLWKGHVDTIERVLTAEAKDRGMQFTIVEEARRPGQPATPTLSGVLLMSGGIGVALAIAAVFLRELLDRSFRDPSRVRQSLGIPVLETIGEICVGPRSGWFSRRCLLPALVSMETFAVLGAGFLVYLSLQQPLLHERIIARSVGLWPG